MPKEAKKDKESENKKEAAKKEGSPDSEKKGGKSKRKGDVQDGSAPLARLAALRPKRKSLLFFVVFLVACLWVLMFYGTCDAMKKRKKKDCGWPGVSEFTCRTAACFLSDSRLDRHAFTMNRTQGRLLGLDMKASKKGMNVDNIKDGAVKEHNEQLPRSSPDRLRVGDRIVKVNGKTGDEMKSLLKDVNKLSLEMEIARPRLGALSPLVPAAWQSSSLGQAIASPSFGELVQKFSYLGSVGVFCWMMSGYPVTSLPLFYLLPAATVAWQSTGCCYNEGVGRDEPHCFRPEGDSVFEMVQKTWRRTTKETLYKWTFK